MGGWIYRMAGQETAPQLRAKWMRGSRGTTQEEERVGGWLEEKWPVWMCRWVSYWTLGVRWVGGWETDLWRRDSNGWGWESGGCPGAGRARCRLGRGPFFGGWVGGWVGNRYTYIYMERKKRDRGECGGRWVVGLPVLRCDRRCVRRRTFVPRRRRGGGRLLGHGPRGCCRG